jgi:hypothetical protein
VKGYRYDKVMDRHFSITDHSILSIENIHHHNNVPRLGTPFRTYIENYWIIEIERNVWRYRVTRSLVFCVVFYIPLFVLLSFFFWTLYCLSVYLRILITPLVPSNVSFYFYYPVIFYICSERCTQSWDIIMVMYILNRQNGMICYTEMPTNSQIHTLSWD